MPHHQLAKRLLLCGTCCLPSLHDYAWWRHQMETFSALLAICAGNLRVHGKFATQRPVRRSFDVFFDLRPNKRLSKQSWGWWFETPSRSLWRHCRESGLIRGRISNIVGMSVWRNDIKRKYMFLFPMKNLARKKLSELVKGIRTIIV